MRPGEVEFAGSKLEPIYEFRRRVVVFRIQVPVAYRAEDVWVE